MTVFSRKKRENDTMGAQRSINMSWLSHIVTGSLIAALHYMGRNCTFSPLPFECQSTLTTESAERNHRFDFPLATERNHRPQRGPADGPVTAKYPGL